MYSPSLFFALLPAASIAATTYHVAKEYSGPKFFDDWMFYDNYDNLTNGNAIWVSSSTASKKELAFINEAGNAVMKVDNTTKLKFGDKRDSIRITTKDRYAQGSLWIADMLHVPFGCSVWPAWWSQAAVWPLGGEIDTFEAVNMVSQSHMALHTQPGCVQTNPVQSSKLINTTDCSYLQNTNEGCTVTYPQTTSYGEAFAAGGGGVFVTEFAHTGVSIWFFDRASIPTSLQGNTGTIDISTLGTPSGNWPTTGCNIDKFFLPQSLIFDITLCGDFAGNPSTFLQTCSGICYDDIVLGPPSNFDNAYFEVKSIRVYNNGTDTTVIGNGSVPSTTVPKSLIVILVSTLVPWFFFSRS